METFRRVRAIPTRHRGVLMRSRLEAHVAAKLDELRIPWVYEPKIFWLRGVRRSGYLPDFLLWPDRSDPWFVEVKPTGIYDEWHTDATDLRTAIERLLIIRKSEPTSTLLLWVADPRDADLGRLLINVPHSTGWVERPAVTWLRAAKLAYRPKRLPWWRRLLGR